MVLGLQTEQLPWPGDQELQLQPLLVLLPPTLTPQEPHRTPNNEDQPAGHTEYEASCDAVTNWLSLEHTPGPECVWHNNLWPSAIIQQENGGEGYPR